MSLISDWGATPYVVVSGSSMEGTLEVIARCRHWEDAVDIATKHCGARIHSEEDNRDYRRHEKTVFEYI